MTAETQRRVAGRYRLLEEIGRGGMGVVWRAHDELLDRPVAVKEVLYRAMSAEDRETFNRRTIREARAAGRLDHPAVVVVHDVIEEDGRPWIVMQLVRSRSLGDVIRAEGPLAPRAVAEIGAQILDALRAAHAAGVLHRDVKPENVLLTESGRVVLTDFGIATMPEETALTTTGNLSGTPAFIPPERLAGRPAVPESDLWSLGATLYAAVEGRPPFDKGAPVPTMAAVLNDPHQPMRLAGPLGQVIDGLLHKEPSQRTPAADAAQALRQVATGHTMHSERSGRTTYAGHPPERHRSSPPRLALLVGVPLTIIAIGGAALYGYHRISTATVASRSDSTVATPPAEPTSSGATPTRSPSAEASPAPRRTIPGDWRTHVDPLGFSFTLPATWQEFDRQKTRVLFRLPGSPSYLLIDTTPWGSTDPLAALRGIEKESVAKKKLPGYKFRSIHAFTFRGWRAAEWEFTWEMQTARAQVVDLAFTTKDGRQFAIYWHTTEDRWKAEYPYFSKFAKTFRPS